MANLVQANQLLDDYLYGRMSVDNMRQVYSQTFKPGYDKLTYRNSNAIFHDDENFKGLVDPSGSVSFKRKIPGYGESYFSPEEMLQSGKQYSNEQQIALEMAASSPQPTRELIKMNRAFQDYSQSSEGNRLFSNQPASPHRAKAYETMGFKYPDEYGYSNTPGEIQYFDNRPKVENQLYNKLYVVGDINEYGHDVAQHLLQNRIEKNNLGSVVTNLQGVLQSTPDIRLPSQLAGSDWQGTIRVNRGDASLVPDPYMLGHAYDLYLNGNGYSLGRDEAQIAHNRLAQNDSWNYQFAGSLPVGW